MSMLKLDILVIVAVLAAVLLLSGCVVFNSALEGAARGAIYQERLKQ